MSPPRYLKLKERDFGQQLASGLLSYYVTDTISYIGGTTKFLVTSVFRTSTKPWADGLRIPFTDTGVRLTKLPWSLPATSRN